MKDTGGYEAESNVATMTLWN